jgi:uncharacterized protein (TIGR02598 family)
MRVPPTCRIFSEPFASRCGFSLVEVSIALGIVSIALLSVLGLMPVGLSTMRQAMDQTTEAQILRRISGEAALVPFDRLDLFASAGPYFFAQDGTLQDQQGQDTRYAVSLQRLAASYPGSSNAVNLSSSLAAFRVETVRLATGREQARMTNVVHLANSGNSAY